MSTTGTSDDAVAIRLIRASEYSKTCDLVLEVFNKFNAEECTEEGLRIFFDLARADVIAKGMLEGDPTWVAVSDSRVVGVIKMRSANHILFFFVGEAWHGKGIGRRLFEAAKLHVREHCPENLNITVNSSSFAVPVYRALGFITTGNPETRRGIRSVPMRLDLE